MGFPLVKHPEKEWPMRDCPLCRRLNYRRKFRVDNYIVVTCNECGFTFLGNPPPLKEEQALYEHYFHQASLGVYSPDSPDPAIQSVWKINEQRLDWIGRFKDQGRMLDVGCGHGFFLHHARLKGYEVEGVEISVAAAQHISESLDIVVHLHNFDEDLNFSGAFDIICLWHSLEHFREPLLVLEQLWNSLTPGGRIFIEVPNLLSLGFRMSLPGRRWQGGNHPRYHRSFFTADTLMSTLQMTGFYAIQFEKMIYPSGTNIPLQPIKRLLNHLNWDSFLDVTAINE
ncbi:MAG: class I SAM-dependent methyltransferase [Calditrichaeota bacterium]|nr:MAG: class I SAM-dependent methyltransferase [Calditrichota bacterium]